jgi:putative cell wall-binding protein
MPGLLRGVARTAVVAGTATAVSNRVSRRQAGRWSQQEQAQADQQQQQYEQQQYEQQQQAAAQAAAQPQPAAGPSMDDKLQQLQQLGQLKDQGVLTEAEFQEQKSRILAS